MYYSETLIPLSFLHPVVFVGYQATILVPQSPRWLLLNDRQDDALASIIRLRKTQDEKRSQAPTSAAVLAEFRDLSQAILALRFATRHASCTRHFLSIFSPQHLKRTTIVVLILFFQQSTGQSFASQYGTLFVKALDTVNPFGVTLATNAVDIGGILLCMMFVDRVGRRPFLIASAFMQTAALLTMGGLGTADSTSTSGKGGIVGMLLLYSFSWSFGYAPLAYVVAAELPSPHLREYTLRVAYTVKLIAEFVISFTYPYLEDVDEANLGGRLGFIYGSIAFLGFVFSVFCVPETKNLELEEMDKQFSKGLFEASTKRSMAAALS
jgi:SP family sugar:H+ symporter-like MFS transporter